ncbi:hypothetical protein K505DRAFT_246673 [Melanomma pulvis-pyrius CBS 109.77]|uniref:N-acetyltransferase domain-containing protein n=1 Tax=Melanomma pulvis-pyrius CBS 109.77 TaxID=1314802 RepID=A0A6A6X9D5_9PLEO|nr:hypothetical protein K505DRAFT_246673 [Melanomma pulvis-pyrius CBS 109.77]
MLGPEGLFAAIYDDGVPVACAGAIPWKYGSQPLAQAGETGWEIKSVTVDPRQAKKGLVSRCIGIVHEYLIAKDSELRKENERTGDGKLRLWIQATEIVNGDYWRRRGYKDVRRIEMPIGYWSAKIPFTMVVLMKELDLDETTESN